MVKTISILVIRFCVVTPTFVTSCGRRLDACDTRFCTFTAAMSAFVPRAK